MLIDYLKKSGGKLFSLIGIVYFLVFFGRPEKTSSKITYLLIGAFALVAFIVNYTVNSKFQDAKDKEEGRYRSRVLVLFSILFGTITVLANYEHYMDFKTGSKLIAIPLLFLAAGAVFINIFLFLTRLLSKHDIAGEEAPKSPVVWFLWCFFILSTTYLCIFYLCSYPGQICSDSMNQIHQIVTGNYSNHHPVYHTWLIGLFYKIGMALFKNINAAVATYTVFQVLFMAASFSFTLTTIVEAGCKKIFAIIWLLWFLLTPCHIIFSFTLWKDSLYGAVILLFTTALFRIYKKIGKRALVNYVLLFFSGIGFNLLRSNGLPAYLLLFLIFVIVTLVTKKPDKKMFMVLLSALIAALIMKFPVLKAMDIPQADTVEMLSIPVQQITRIAKETDDFTDSERAVLEQIASIEDMKEKYNPRIYDYARDVIRYNGNQQYIKDHPLKCFGTWFTIVMRHPVLATRAWVDQTSGYWNPCSYYWMKWWDGVCAEDGLYLRVYSYEANDLFHSYVKAFTDDNAILVQTYNVGLHVWIILLGVACCIYNRRKEVIYALPVLCLVATLLIATLMHDEFRFGYPVYTCLPLIVFSAFSGGKNAEKENVS